MPTRRKNTGHAFETVSNSRLFSDASYLFAEKIFRLCLLGFMAVLVARYLGPDRYGALTYAQAYTSLFMPLALFGLDNILVKFLVERRFSAAEIIGSGIILKLFFSIIAAISSVSTARLINSDEEIACLIIICSLSLIFSPLNIFDFYFQSAIENKYSAIGRFVAVTIASLATFYFIVFEMPVAYFAAVNGLQALVLGASLFVLFARKRVLRSLQISLEVITRLLKEAWPLVLSAALVTLYIKVDQIMIGNLMGRESAGYYGAAVKVSEFLYFLPVLATTTLFPVLIKYRSGDTKRYQSWLNKAFVGFAWCGIAVSVPLHLFSESLMVILFGDEFRISHEAFEVHVLGLIFVCIGTLSGRFFIAEGLQIFMFYRSAIGACLNIGLNVVMIPKYGIEGAAWSTLACQVVSTYLLNAASPKTRPVFWSQTRALFLPHTVLGGHRI